MTADFTNSATASGTPPVGPVVTDTDTAAVDVIAPAINIEKTPDSQSFQTGGTVTFTITVTNSGDVTLSSVAVTDALAPGVRGRLRSWVRTRRWPPLPRSTTSARWRT